MWYISCDFLKGINLKIVADLVHESWTETSSTIFQKSWQTILPTLTPSPPIASSSPLAVPDEEMVCPESPESQTSMRPTVDMVYGRVLEFNLLTQMILPQMQLPQM